MVLPGLQEIGVTSTVRHELAANAGIAGSIGVRVRARDVASRMRMPVPNVMFDTVRGPAAADADR
jgi:hypothetical protein